MTEFYFQNMIHAEQILARVEGYASTKQSRSNANALLIIMA